MKSFLSLAVVALMSSSTQAVTLKSLAQTQAKETPQEFEARLAAENAEAERKFNAQMERERIVAQAKLAEEAAERERVAHHAFEQHRLAEEARLEEEAAEIERLHVDKTEKARLRAEAAERERVANE